MALSGQSKRLSRGDRSALQPLKKAAKPSATAPEPIMMGFADRILKRQDRDAWSEYKLLDVIPPTSKIIERLFSSARMVLRYECNILSPFTLEMIPFSRSMRRTGMLPQLMLAHRYTMYFVLTSNLLLQWLRSNHLYP
ncbi:hypothetical protein JG687_00006833 [Phytophthora cactorum]|uniref:HAT C-terminal dimerisation domain-containing protein n=1 Tax=Phytophthora cactorum TaxID=29920 RepID=A0A8T1UIG4_9STRA|nr:hypothetical protein JG687_00006833 [Phytophthora cactorum]